MILETEFEEKNISDEKGRVMIVGGMFNVERTSKSDHSKKMMK